MWYDVKAPASPHEKLKELDWLIGDWVMDATVHMDDGTTFKGSGEIHFGWVLQGRAIQDVWILPGVFHGTTLRIYDPGLGAWHILWNDPLRQFYARQIGRAQGNDIVQTQMNRSESRSGHSCARVPFILMSEYRLWMKQERWWRVSAGCCFE